MASLSHLQGHLNATTLAHSHTQDELRRVAAALAVKEVREFALYLEWLWRGGGDGILVSGDVVSWSVMWCGVIWCDVVWYCVWCCEV